MRLRCVLLLGRDWCGIKFREADDWSLLHPLRLSGRARTWGVLFRCSDDIPQAKTMVLFLNEAMIEHSLVPCLRHTCTAMFWKVGVSVCGADL